MAIVFLNRRTGCHQKVRPDITSKQVADQIETERAQLQQHWQQRLERAHYEVARAARQHGWSH